MSTNFASIIRASFLLLYAKATLTWLNIIWSIMVLCVCLCVFILLSFRFLLFDIFYVYLPFSYHLLQLHLVAFNEIRFLSICWNICGIKVKLVRSYAHNLDAFQLFQVSLPHSIIFFLRDINPVIIWDFVTNSCWEDLIWKRGTCWRDCWV